MYIKIPVMVAFMFRAKKCTNIVVFFEILQNIIFETLFILGIAL